MPFSNHPFLPPLGMLQHPPLFGDQLLPNVMARRLGDLMRQTGSSPNGYTPAAPGCIFVVRRAGLPFLDVHYGWARMPQNGSLNDDRLPMTEDTLVHIASMSKPITAAATIAMFEDWAEIFAELQALPPAPRHLPSKIGLLELPRALLPIFGDNRVAARIVAESLLHRFPADWRELIVAAAQAYDMDPQAPHSSYPLQEGLLMSVLRGLPNPGNAWLPADPISFYVDLIDRRLQFEAVQLGLTVDYGPDLRSIAVIQFLQQASGMREEQDSDGPTSQPPDGGRASYDLWRRLISLFADGSFHGGRYLNSNYTALGALIEAVTDVKYVDWVRYRVLNDTRFSLIGRRAEPQMLAAKYYGENFAGTAGTFHPDYTDWSGDGGWYVTAAQITDWLHVLHSGAPYGHAGRPIVSEAGRGWLFDPGLAFTGNVVNLLTDAAGRQYQSYEHNGSTGVQGGSTNGKMAVIVPNLDGYGSIYTVFLLANGPVEPDWLFHEMILTLFAHIS